MAHLHTPNASADFFHYWLRPSMPASLCTTNTSRRTSHVTSNSELKFNLAGLVFSIEPFPVLEVGGGLQLFV